VQPRPRAASAESSARWWPRPADRRSQVALEALRRCGDTAVADRIKISPQRFAECRVRSAQVWTHVATKSVVDANAHAWVDVEVIEL
jgi:hypothetical protein